MSDYKPDPNYLGSIMKNKGMDKKLAFRIKEYQYEGKTFKTIQVSEESKVDGKWKFVKVHDKFPYKTLDIPASTFTINKIIELLEAAKMKLDGKSAPVTAEEQHSDEIPF